MSSPTPGGDIVTMTPRKRSLKSEFVESKCNGQFTLIMYKNSCVCHVRSGRSLRIKWPTRGTKRQR